MSPQAEQFVAKARSLLTQARAMMTISLPDAVGRNAYLAAFHVAQALIFERNGRVAKTHRGVQSEFLRQAEAFVTHFAAVAANRPG